MSFKDTIRDIPLNWVLNINSGLMINQIGIDTVHLVARYQTVVKMIDKQGLKVHKAKKNTPYARVIDKALRDVNSDDKRRYKKDEFKPLVEVVQIGKGKVLSNYMMIVRYTPILMDYAREQKKAKGEFCMVIFSGLHQPTKELNTQSIKVISKFLKRKSFRMVSLDIAIDTSDNQEISYKSKDSFGSKLKPYSNKGVISNGSSLYINNILDGRLERIIYYDKYKKQTQQGQQIDSSFENWKRLEVTFSSSIKSSVGFIEYVEGMRLIDDLARVQGVASKLDISFDTSYLNYMINSILDNRYMNNNISKKRFNSFEAVKRFIQKDFRNYALF